MKGHPKRYDVIELWFIEHYCAMPRRELHAHFIRTFNRTDVSMNDIKSLCSRRGWKSAFDGRFEKGKSPPNKGKKMPFNPNNARTQFKKGQRPSNTKYAGHERLSKDGYIEISVNETNPHTGFERRYVQKHRWLWEKLHGPVPKGMCLKCLGDQRDTNPANWELIPRALLPRLNGRFGRGFDAAPDELKPTIMAVAKLEHQLREKAR